MNIIVTLRKSKLPLVDGVGRVWQAVISDDNYMLATMVHPKKRLLKKLVRREYGFEGTFHKEPKPRQLPRFLRQEQP